MEGELVHKGAAEQGDTLGPRERANARLWQQLHTRCAELTDSMRRVSQVLEALGLPTTVAWLHERIPRVEKAARAEYGVRQGAIEAELAAHRAAHPDIEPFAEGAETGGVTDERHGGRPVVFRWPEPRPERPEAGAIPIAGAGFARRARMDDLSPDEAAAGGGDGA